jgi:methylglyoxal/glyoxal reductase
MCESDNSELRSKMMNLETTVTLNNGVEIPRVGLGVFKAEPGQATEQAVRWALEIGYRHIDTAALYENEEDVGRAIAGSDLDRDLIFVTTKVGNPDQGYENTLKAFDESRKKLQMDTVDLYLIHWPVTGLYKETWKALEKLYGEGKARAIGVSNFLVHHLEDLLGGTEITPAVNQVEFHPFLVQKDLLEYGRVKNIRHEAWSPLTRATRFDHPVIQELSSKYQKTPAQILIRWDIQLGVVTIPKSVHRERIEENSKVFDFELEEQDVDKLLSLDAAERLGPDPDTFV